MGFGTGAFDLGLMISESFYFFKKGGRAVGLFDESYLAWTGVGWEWE